jgi:hypothetical protein
MVHKEESISYPRDNGSAQEGVHVAELDVEQKDQITNISYNLIMPES